MCDLYGDSKQETAFTHCNWNLVGDQIIMWTFFWNMIFSIFLFLILCLDIIKINKNNILIKEMCAVAINKINLQYLKLNNVYNLHRYLKRYKNIK